MPKVNKVTDARKIAQIETEHARKIVRKMSREEYRLCSDAQIARYETYVRC